MLLHQYHSLHFFSCTEYNWELLMRKWSHFLPSADISGSTDCDRMNPVDRMNFNVFQLQEDVVAMYLAGKPRIESAQSLYTSFSFVSQHGTSNE